MILATNSPKRVLMATFLNKYSLYDIRILPPPFASKQTFARIDFLRQGERLVNRKGTHNVKFVTEKVTKVDGLTSGQVNELIGRLIVFWHKYVHFDIRT